MKVLFIVAIVITLPALASAEAVSAAPWAPSSSVASQPSAISAPSANAQPSVTPEPSTDSQSSATPAASTPVPEGTSSPSPQSLEPITLRSPSPSEASVSAMSRDSVSPSPDADEVADRRPGRIALGSLVGLGSGILGAFAGGVVGGLVTAALFPGCSGGFLHVCWWTLGAFLGTAAGYPAGVAVGYAAIGGAMDGNGVFISTLAGAYAGMGLAILTTVPFPPIGVLAIPAFPIAGAAIGYEATSANSRTEAERRRSMVRVTPYVSVSGRLEGAVFSMRAEF